MLVKGWNDLDDHSLGMVQIESFKWIWLRVKGLGFRV
jgi:hypothetical protein